MRKPSPPPGCLPAHLTSLPGIPPFSLPASPSLTCPSPSAPSALLSGRGGAGEGEGEAR